MIHTYRLDLRGGPYTVSINAVARSERESFAGLTTCEAPNQPAPGQRRRPFDRRPLKHVFERKLQQSRIPGGLDLPEVRIVDCRNRKARIQVVWKIERFGPELYALPFANLESSSYSHIDLNRPRDQHIRCAKRGIRAQRGLAKRLRVQVVIQRLDVALRAPTSGLHKANSAARFVGKKGSGISKSQD